MYKSSTGSVTSPLLAIDSLLNFGHSGGYRVEWIYCGFYLYFNFLHG